ncbi:MAG: hypothetical protein ACXW32_11630 [Limisphaerales bacterium]
MLHISGDHLSSQAMKALLLFSTILTVAISYAAEPTANEKLAADILKQINRYDRWPKREVVLLAHVSREDSRPWFVENALLLVNSGNRWALAHAVRNPRFPNGKPAGKWGLHDVMDAPWSGDRFFDHRPTEEEVKKFLTDTDWTWHSIPRSFRVTSRIVDDEAWQKHLGFPPPVSGKDASGIHPTFL